MMEHWIIKKTLIGILGVTVMMTFSSCFYDVEEEIYPMENMCDTMAVSFSQTILPLFSGNCLPCHATGSNDGGITLDNYTSAKMAVDGGRILGALRQESGFAAMPRNASKLSDCIINQISAWIDQGALDN